LAVLEEEFERRRDVGLARSRREVEDPEVLAVAALAEPLVERVVGPAEDDAGVELVAVPVAAERAGLPDERVDHVPVVDPVAALPANPLEPVDDRLAQADLQKI